MVLKFNSNGIPLYWYNEEDAKVYRRIDKNSYEVVKTPKQFERKVHKLRLEFIRNRQNEATL